MILWVLIGLGCYGLLCWVLWTFLKTASDADDRLEVMFLEDRAEEWEAVDSAVAERR